VNHEPLTEFDLAELSIFAGMTGDERTKLLEIASRMEFEPGEIVLREGKASQNLLIVLEGRCQVVKLSEGEPARQNVLAELGPGDHFGEMSFFHAAPHSASVRALSPLKVLRIERKDYEALLDRDGVAGYKLAYNVLGELAERMRRMDAWVTQLLARVPDGQSRVSEWSHFRDKLFNGWKW